MDKDKINMQLNEVLVFQEKGQSWEAMKRLKELAHSEPGNAFLQKLLGNIYSHMGLLDWAVDYYKRAIEIDEKYIDAHYDLGVAYYHRAKIVKAISQFHVALKLDPEYHAAHYRLGVCYKHMSDHDKAVNHFIESTIVTPEYVMAHFHLGEIYYEQGNLQKAVMSFERVADDNPEAEASLRYIKKIQKEMKMSGKENATEE